MTLVLGKIEGRRRGQKRMRGLEGSTNSVHMGLSKLREMVKDGEACRAAVRGVTKTRLSDWATTMGSQGRTCSYAGDLVCPQQQHERVGLASLGNVKVLDCWGMLHVHKARSVPKWPLDSRYCTQVFPLTLQVRKLSLGRTANFWKVPEPTSGIHIQKCS